MSQGWSWSRKGYLSERDWAFSLAIFFRLTEREPVQAKPWLKPHLFEDFRKALRSLDGRQELMQPLKGEGPAARAAAQSGPLGPGQDYMGKP